MYIHNSEYPLCLVVCHMLVLLSPCLFLSVSISGCVSACQCLSLSCLDVPVNHLYMYQSFCVSSGYLIDLCLFVSIYVCFCVSLWLSVFHFFHLSLSV